MTACLDSLRSDSASRRWRLGHLSRYDAVATAEAREPAVALLRPGLDRLDAVDERLLEHALADRPEHELEQPSLEVLALADDDVVDVGRAVGIARERVGVARGAAPGVRVGRRQDDAVGIGPVVVQALPDAARALRDVGLGGRPWEWTLR